MKVFFERVVESDWEKAGRTQLQTAADDRLGIPRFSNSFEEEVKNIQRTRTAAGKPMQQQRYCLNTPKIAGSENYRVTPCTPARRPDRRPARKMSKICSLFLLPTCRLPERDQPAGIGGGFLYHAERRKIWPAVANKSMLQSRQEHQFTMAKAVEAGQLYHWPPCFSNPFIILCQRHCKRLH